MNIFKNMSEEKQKAELTSKVLKCISDHLSGRQDCRGRIYRVAIYVRDDEQIVSKLWPTDYKEIDGDVKECGCSKSIFFDAPIRVCPDIYHRRDIDKHPVIQHVIMEHFYEELFAGSANGNQVQILRGKLVPGVYEYRPYNSNNRRRWVKVI